MADGQDYDLSRADFEGYVSLHLKAGRRGIVHVVPPAGENYAWDYHEWARRVEVSISPKGRSVRVWVDGVEIRGA